MRMEEGREEPARQILSSPPYYQHLTTFLVPRHDIETVHRPRVETINLHHRLVGVYLVLTLEDVVGRLVVGDLFVKDLVMSCVLAVVSA